jgi:hypothetical protein
MDELVKKLIADKVFSIGAKLNACANDSKAVAKKDIEQCAIELFVLAKSLRQQSS